MFCIIIQFLVLDVSHGVNCQVRNFLTSHSSGSGTKLLLGFDPHVCGKIPWYFDDRIVVSSTHLGSWIPFVLVLISFDCSTHVSPANQ
jgi:hypothetical protein